MNAAQLAFKFILVWGIGIPATFSWETIDDLKEVGITNVEIVKEIPGMPNAAGAYRFKDQKIFLDRDLVAGNRGRSDVIAAHEVIHMIRHKNGLWSDDIVFEEAIAIYGTRRVAKELFDVDYTINLERYWRETMKANGLPVDSSVDDEAVEAAILEVLELLSSGKF